MAAACAVREYPMNCFCSFVEKKQIFFLRSEILLQFFHVIVKTFTNLAAQINFLNKRWRSLNQSWLDHSREVTKKSPTSYALLEGEMKL